jgi:hypothetical protein
VARALGGADPTGTMSRAHAEITALAQRIGLLCTETLDTTETLIPETLDGATDAPQELCRTIEQLHAVLRLHFAQEEESYFVLADWSGDENRRDAPFTWLGR